MVRSSPRLARRREETRARILHVAGRRFAAAGVDHVRLDEIADEADVARGTLYNYFPTKESLLCALLEPVLERATRAVRGLEALGPRRGVDALLALYLELWREYPDPLRVSHIVPQMPGELADLHRTFLRGVLQIFERSARAGILRGGDATMAARIIARLAVPLLEVYAGHPQADVLFIQSFHALLLSG
jgi:AcrR family transcriptional regulator